ncbi:ankyrin repeat and SOCS box protein 2-like isoform 1-T1 [Leptodactylus fuscus]|uniref:ankyrin repeat and SOCS box protein 2-like n=1 Tax=Leptodactylus fuscus TaxID=238119 RepID=UPI003F4EF08B
MLFKVLPATKIRLRRVKLPRRIAGRRRQYHKETTENILLSDGPVTHAVLYWTHLIFGHCHSVSLHRVIMLNSFSSEKEEALRVKIRDTMKANNPEDLRELLSKDKVKKLIQKTGGKVLTESLDAAILEDNLECMEELLKAGAYPDPADWCRPVFRAVAFGKGRFLKLLLDYGASPDSSEDRNLYFSANRAELGIFITLLLYGADPDYSGLDEDLQQDTYHHSVIGMCLDSNYEVPFMELLIQFGANMYLPDIQKILLHADNDAARYLSKERVHPRSLMSQCRIAIRRRLVQVGKLRLLDQLQIPTNLVRYLQYHNELDYPDKLPRYYELQSERYYRRFPGLIHDLMTNQ